MTTASGTARKIMTVLFNFSHPMDNCGEESVIISAVCFRLVLSWNNGIMTFSNLIVMYYISLKVFQHYYRHTKVVKCLMLLITSISSIILFFFL